MPILLPSNPNASPREDWPEHLGTRIRETLHENLTPRGVGVKIQGRFFSLRVKNLPSTDSEYNYNDALREDHPEKLLDDLGHGLSKLRMGLVTMEEDRVKVFDRHIVDKLASMIYGSNMIARVGSDDDVTRQLCAQVFGHTPWFVPDLPDHGFIYDRIEHNIRGNRWHPCDRKTVQQKYREIVQHAHAARFLIEELFVQGKDLTEPIILEAHGILTHGIDACSGESHVAYSGIYRRTDIESHFWKYLRPQEVPGALRNLLTELNIQLDVAAIRGKIDPVLVATQFAHRFIHFIHPFVDGNGRLGRLILNTLLLKYGGTLVAVGHVQLNMARYCEIASDAIYLEGQTEAARRGPILPIGHRRPFHDALARLTLECAVEGVTEMIMVTKSIISREESPIDDSDPDMTELCLDLIRGCAATQRGEHYRYTEASLEKLRELANSISERTSSAGTPLSVVSLERYTSSPLPSSPEPPAGSPLDESMSDLSSVGTDI